MAVSGHIPYGGMVDVEIVADVELEIILKILQSLAVEFPELVERLWLIVRPVRLGHEIYPVSFFGVPLQKPLEVVQKRIEFILVLVECRMAEEIEVEYVQVHDGIDLFVAIRGYLKNAGLFIWLRSIPIGRYLISLTASPDLKTTTAIA